MIVEAPYLSYSLGKIEKHQNDLDKVNDWQSQIRRIYSDNMKLEFAMDTIEAQKEINDQKQQILENKSKIDSLNNLITNYYKKLNNDEIKIKLILENIYSINFNYNKFQKDVAEVDKIVKRYNNYISKINRPDFTEEDYLKICNATETDLEQTPIINPNNLKKYYSELNYFQSSYEDFIYQYNRSIYNIKTLRLNNENDVNLINTILLKDAENVKNAVVNAYDNIIKKNINARLNEVEILHREMQEPENYIYTSSPFQAYGDRVVLDVELNAKNEYKNSLSFDGRRKFSIEYPVAGGVRLDFGLGMSFDFGKNNQEYDVYEIDNQKYLKKIDDNKYTPKLVGMLHTSIKSQANTAFGLSLGTALDVANFDINSIYLGPSVLFGRNSKIIITSGVAFRNIKELKSTNSQYIYDNKSKVVLPDNFTLDDSSYVKNFKTGFFFAITYNLTSKQRKNFLQPVKK